MNKAALRLFTQSIYDDLALESDNPVFVSGASAFRLSCSDGPDLAIAEHDNQSGLFKPFKT